MPQPLRPGVYDRIIDRRIRQLIEALDEGVRSDEAALDTADVPDRMSRLFAEAIRSALERLPRGERRTARAWVNDLEAPLAVHARYRRGEVLAALEVVRNGTIRVEAGPGDAGVVVPAGGGGGAVNACLELVRASGGARVLELLGR